MLYQMLAVQKKTLEVFKSFNQVKRFSFLNEQRLMYFRIKNTCMRMNTVKRSFSEISRSSMRSSCPTISNLSSRNESVYSGFLLPKVSICSKEKQHLKVQDVSTSQTAVNGTVNISKCFDIQRAKAGQCSKTLVIIFGFYGAPKTAIQKYCDLYHSHGFDSIFVHSYLRHFTWPKNSEVLATDLLEFLIMNCSKYENIVIHAFSMGAYNFTLCINELYTCPQRYSSIERRITAVVYDSLTIGTLKNMAEGVGQGLSQNVVIQKIIPLSMSLYFKLTNKFTVQVYEHFINMFKQKPLKVPTLIFYCKNDPMSEYKDIEALVNDWRERLSLDVTGKCWEKSKHSCHLLQHKDEYITTLDQFLKSVPGLLKVESKI